mgnify:CR=1 FL=1
MGKGKRQYRELSDVTKQKISRKLKNQSKSEAHRQGYFGGDDFVLEGDS